MPTLADPTLDFIDSLDDPSQWIIKRRVPIMVPHTRYVKDKKTGEQKFKYRVTASDLPEIAAEMQQLQASGNPGRVTPGHINDAPDFPESEQPPVIGYQLNAEVGTWGPQKRLGVLVDIYIRKDLASYAVGRPFRSPEYYPTTKQIRGLALLARDPALDMGVAEMLQENYAEPVMADENENEKPEVAATPEAVADPNAMTPEEEATAEKYMSHYLKKHSWMAKCSAQFGDPTEPNANNATIPTEVKDKEDVERMQLNDERINYSKLQNEVVTLRNEVKMLTDEKRKAKAEQLVTQLKAENYQLDLAEEVKDLLDMPETKWPAYEAKIRKRYARSSTGQGFIDTESNGPVETLQRDANAPATAIEAGKAVRLMTAKGIEFNDALKEVRKGVTA